MNVIGLNLTEEDAELLLEALGDFGCRLEADPATLAVSADIHRHAVDLQAKLIELRRCLRLAKAEHPHLMRDCQPSAGG